MSVINSTHVKSQPVPGAKYTRMQVLISPTQGANFAMRRFCIKAGGGMPPHTNRVEHEQYVLQGKAQIGIGNETYTVETGQAIYIPAGIPHWYQNNGEDDFLFLCLVPNKQDQIEILDVNHRTAAAGESRRSRHAAPNAAGKQDMR
jgi:quercetin dioxygenase-like cupin family protein